MINVKVAIVQIGSGDNKADNLEKSLNKVRELKGESIDLVVFPEYQMFKPDYSNPKGIREASEFTSGNFVSSFVALSKEQGINILLNIAEKNDGSLRPFNTSVLIDDLGVITGKYRKRHLFDAYSMKESGVYQHGYGKLEPFRAARFTLGPQICYDLRFTEASRIMRLKGSQILSYQAGWFRGERKVDQWMTLLRARAMENGAFVLGTGNCAEDFIGHSAVITPYGDVIAQAEYDETTLIAEIDLKIIDEYLDEVPLLKARRTDIYDLYDASGT